MYSLKFSALNSTQKCVKNKKNDPLTVSLKGNLHVDFLRLWAWYRPEIFLACIIKYSYQHISKSSIKKKVEKKEKNLVGIPTRRSGSETVYQLQKLPIISDASGAFWGQWAAYFEGF